jgi:two-component system response regulator ArlR
MRQDRTIRELRILIVDDEEVVLEMLKGYLELLVAEVYTAPNGEAGLVAFERYRPDAIITDLKMPFMDGFEMTSRIREVDGDIPVFVLSAFIEPTILERYSGLRFAGVFRKPLFPGDLRRALEELAAHSDERDPAEL